MSLEELRTDWGELDQSTNYDNLSREQIEVILKSQYRSFINKMFVLEILILLAYLYFIVLTIFRFAELEKIYLETLGFISITILAWLFVVRLIKLKNTFRTGYLSYAHATALKDLAKQKVRIQKFYLLNIFLGFLLVVILIILNIKIYQEFDLIQSKIFWMTIIPGSLLFIVFVNFWIKNHYIKATREAEELLLELD